MVIGLFGSITRGPCGRLGISFVNWVDKIDGRSRGSREVAVWDVEVIFRSGSDSGLVGVAQGCDSVSGDGIKPGFGSESARFFAWASWNWSWRTRG